MACIDVNNDDQTSFLRNRERLQRGNQTLDFQNYKLQIINYYYYFPKNTFKPSKPNGNYMSHLLQQSVALHFVFMGFI
jgi:hypothetical protein